MWIKTNRGVLLNLDHIESIAMRVKESRLVAITPNDEEYELASGSETAVSGVYDWLDHILFVSPPNPGV